MGREELLVPGDNGGAALPGPLSRVDNLLIGFALAWSSKSYRVGSEKRGA